MTKTRIPASLADLNAVTLAGTSRATAFPDPRTATPVPTDSRILIMGDEQTPVPTAARETDDPDVTGVLVRPTTTTPPFANRAPRGDVAGMPLTPGVLRALLQPILVMQLREPVGEFGPGDMVAAQFWGEGRVMVTPLPAAASRGRVPTTFAANLIHAYVDGKEPNPGMLRALLQPVLFLEFTEPRGAFEAGDVVMAQFWGDGRVMLTPLPSAASRGRIPTTYAASQIRVKIAQANGHAEGRA